MTCRAPFVTAVSFLVAMTVSTGAHPRQSSPSAANSAPFTGAQARALMDKYCVTCHNDRAKTGGLSLVQVDLANAGKHAGELEKVVLKLRGGIMPPGGSARPDAAAYKTLIAWLEQELDRAAVAAPNAGRTEAMHRLNRAEYQNAIRDLLGIESLEIEQMLPADDASYGFDNMAGSLPISPTHLERYLMAAQKISRIAVGDTAIPPYGETKIVPLDFGQDGRLETAPLGTRGGAIVRRYFPVDGEYLIRFQTVAGFGVSAEESHFVEVTIDGERVFYTKVRQQTATQLEDVDAGTNHDLRLPIKGGLRSIAITFVERTAAQAEEFLQPYLRPPAVSQFKHARVGGYAGPYVGL